MGAPARDIRSMPRCHRAVPHLPLWERACARSMHQLARVLNKPWLLMRGAGLPAIIATRIPQRAASVSVAVNDLEQAAMDVAFVGATSVAMLYALPPLLVSRTSAFPQGLPLALVAVPAATRAIMASHQREQACFPHRQRHRGHGVVETPSVAGVVGARLRANKPTSTGLPDQPGPVDCDADLPGQGRHNRSGLPSRGQRCRAQRILERSWMLGPATMNLP